MAYDSTTWSTDANTKATLSSTTSENITISGTLAVTGATTLSSTLSANGATIGVDSDSVLAQSTGTGTSNTIFGKNAGDSIASGATYNTLFGENAGTAISTGDENTVIGYNSGDALTTGGRNIVIGHSAFGTANTNESRNIAIGYEALKSFDSDNGGGGSDGLIYNIAIGYEALEALTTGFSSTVIGGFAGKALTIGKFNTACGTSSLATEVEGNGNTAMGYHALQVANAGGSDGTPTDTVNTCVGYQAGDGITTGVQNTGLGADVAFDIDANNQTAIGYGATTDSANDIAIGNTNVDEVKGQVDFTVFSDERIKTNIVNNDLGLDFINLLKPRKFNKVNPAEYPDSIKKSNDGLCDWTDTQANKVWDGLVAQEVKSAIDTCNTTFSGWSEESNSKQLLTYSALVMPLIKAVQELSAEIENLKS